MSGKRWERYTTIFDNVRKDFMDFLKENGIFFIRTNCVGSTLFEVKAYNEQFPYITAAFNAFQRLDEIEDLDCPEFDCEVA